MLVLIAKQNQPLIAELVPKAKFTESTKHTSTFKVTEKTFLKLYNELKLKGYNPYAVMNW